MKQSHKAKMMKKLLVLLMAVSLPSFAQNWRSGGGVTSWADIVTAQSCSVSGGVLIPTDGTCLTLGTGWTTALASAYPSAVTWSSLMTSLGVASPSDSTFPATSGTIATIPSVSGPVTTGAIPVGSGSNWALISAVASGQPLLSAGLVTAPAYAGYTFAGTAAQTYTFPSTSKTLASLDGVEVLSNKSITPRNDPITHSTADDTVTLPNSDSYDWVEISLSNASPGAITIAAPTTGTPTAGRTMTFCLKATTTNAPTSYAYSNIAFTTGRAAPTTPSAFGSVDCVQIQYSGLKSGWVGMDYNFGF